VRSFGHGYEPSSFIKALNLLTGSVFIIFSRKLIVIPKLIIKSILVARPECFKHILRLTPLHPGRVFGRFEVDVPDIPRAEF
jgi:hypothetical protein